MARRRRAGVVTSSPDTDDTSDRPRITAEEFQAIAVVHQAHLQTVAVRFTGDRDAAQDLVQETLARALVHFGQFHPGSNVRAWLVTILTRLFLDQVKHDKVVTRAEPVLVTQEIVESDIDMAIASVSDVVLWDAVRLLDPELREVVELRYPAQLSYKAIADQLAIPVGTVGTRLKRAHERLKQILQPRMS